MLKTKKGKLYFTAIVLVAAAIVCVILVALLTRKPAAEPITPKAEEPEVIIKEVEKPVEKLIEIEKLVEVEKEITAEMVEDGLREMGTLTTQEYFFTEVVTYSSIKSLLNTNIKLGFTESSYLASYDGVVRAGIDFSKISVAKDEAGTTIRIKLPAAEIQSIDIDPNSFELYSEKVGFANPISVEDFNSSLVELEQTARQKAIDRGVLERADENAQTVIRNFVGSLIDLSGCRLEITRG